MNIRACQTVWNGVTGAASTAEVRITRGAEQAGDQAERADAFHRLVGPRLDRAYGLAWHLLGNATDAEDACQEALLAAWSALAPPPGSWPVRRVVRAHRREHLSRAPASAVAAVAGSAT